MEPHGTASHRAVWHQDRGSLPVTGRGMGRLRATLPLSPSTETQESSQYGRAAINVLPRAASAILRGGREH